MSTSHWTKVCSLRSEGDRNLTRRLSADEDDVFGSDFESTDEEGAQEDVDAAAEKLIRQEESRVRKVIAPAFTAIAQNSVTV